MPERFGFVRSVNTKVKLNWGNKVQHNIVNDFDLEAFARECDKCVELVNDSYVNIQDEDNDKTTKLKHT